MKYIINKVLHLFELRKGRNTSKTIYLTFDDGPESGVTEFVLDELAKFNFKATFFCRGDNAERHPLLIKKIIEQGHEIGNHTYSHINSFTTEDIVYISDVQRADTILQTRLFRPPWGCLTLNAFLSLRKKYRIVYWSLISGDSELNNFNKAHFLKLLTDKTKPGDIILFHFCKKHERETREILPDYLLWLSINNYHSELIK